MQEDPKRRDCDDGEDAEEAKVVDRARGREEPGIEQSLERTPLHRICVEDASPDLRVRTTAYRHPQEGVVVGLRVGHRRDGNEHREDRKSYSDYGRARARQIGTQARADRSRACSLFLCTRERTFRADFSAALRCRHVSSNHGSYLARRQGSVGESVRD